MLEANQAVMDNASTLLGNTVLWRRDGAISTSSMQAGLKQGLVTAPFSKDSLFGRKPVASVVSETEQDKLNRAIHSLSTTQYKKPAALRREGTQSLPRELQCAALLCPDLWPRNNGHLLRGLPVGALLH